MIHLQNQNKKSGINRTETSYNKKFMMARMYLELTLQEDKLSNPTKALLDHPPTLR